MAVTYRHYSEWHLIVTPGEGETWPRLHDRAGREFQPTGIHVNGRSGDGLSWAVRGKLIRKDGTVGLKTTGLRELPEWAAQLAVDAAKANGHDVTDLWVGK